VSVIHDIRWFLFVLLVIMAGTVCAFYSLFIGAVNVQGDGYDYTSTAISFLTVYDMLLLNSVNLEPMASSEYRIILLAMFVLSIFAVSIILLNLLVGKSAPHSGGRMHNKMYDCKDLWL